MYWNINEILPYQRNFNLINGSRSIGKTYTLQKWLIKKCYDNNKQFIYLVRTKNELNSHIFEQAFDKVLSREYPDMESIFDLTEFHFGGKTIGFALALSDFQRNKKRSFPNVDYLMFDEYMIEKDSPIRYVSGWNEPNLFLNLYHSIDREEDRVKCFMLGNNVTFYNPYHMHPAFQFNEEPYPGCILTKDNVLFQWALPSAELQDSRKNSKFLNMIAGTDYDAYANKGVYIEDSSTFVEPRSDKARHLFVIIFNSVNYGIWFDSLSGIAYVDFAYDPSCRFKYAITLQDHSNATMFNASHSRGLLGWFTECFKDGSVRFVSVEVKKRFEPALKFLL